MSTPMTTGQNARVLCFDFGASSGRAMLCSYKAGKLELQEVHRFDNTPVEDDGTLRWDFATLCSEIKTGLKNAHEAGGFDCVGVDTWGVDFGLLDENDRLIEPPVHYRDSRVNGLSDEVDKLLSRADMYARNGLQQLEFNTLYQLYAIKKQNPALLAKAKTLLLMPDLFNWFLTGEKAAEVGIASTTQFLDPRTGEWDTALLEMLDLPASILPPLRQPGGILGNLRPELCGELGIPSAPVAVVASHDTASAVAAMPVTRPDTIYLSCGTWSLLGTQLEKPLMTETARKSDLTNEIGYRTITFHKNIIGLWLIQETRRQYKREGKNYSYAEMEQLACASEPFACFIDPDDALFVPPGDIPGRVREFCRRTGQTPPATDGAVVRCIYESIAMRYRNTCEGVVAATGQSYGCLHVVGGGVKDGLLCGMSASSTGYDVKAGPIEASALGNAVVQLIALGALQDLADARGAVAASFGLLDYQPGDTAAWNAAYQRFVQDALQQ